MPVVLPAWTVVISAAVTYDLREAIEADLKEAHTALEAMPDGAGITVHVWKHGPAFPTPEAWRNGVEVPQAETTLREFLNNTPDWTSSRRLMLVLWGHGTRAFPVVDVRQTAPDPEALGPDVMTAERVGKQLGEEASDSPAAPDVIGYDACRMASLENVVQFARDFPAALFVGSMVPEPASGWPYFQLLDILQKRDWTNRAVASALVEAYAASVDTGDWCMVALDLGTVHTVLVPALAKLVDKCEPPSSVDFLAAAEGADILDDTDMVDLGALMRRLDLRGPAEPNEFALAVRKALVDATVARRAAGNLAGRDGLAVRVWLPPWGTDSVDEWFTDPSWDRFLPDLPV